MAKDWVGCQALSEAKEILARDVKKLGLSLLELLDEDNDGQVTQEEFDAAMKKREEAIARGEIVEDGAKTLGEMLAPALRVLEDAKSALYASQDNLQAHGPGLP